ncbi:MAG: hypothetical protein M3O01_13740 [Pseudomonadota bacterium]|nr:hypothetical protein [Pseudomonadota bacterium]
MSIERLTERGMSLVELLVGVAVGLTIVAACTATLVTQVRETRRMVLESRQMQELRGAAERLARDLRRAGHRGEAGAGVHVAGAGPIRPNPYAPPLAPMPGEVVSYGYASTKGHADQFGVRLRDATVEWRLGPGNWQGLTDPAAVEVTELTVAPFWQDTSLAPYCANPCPEHDASCPPRQRVMHYAIELQGRLPGTAQALRTFRTTVRVRNDTRVGACAP